MKKLLLLALTAVMMAGCESRNSDGSIVITTSHGINDYYVETIDSCEYVCHNNRMAHKGNCKFCQERREKELKELIREIKKE